jgi:Tol biopolymer transport system component
MNADGSARTPLVSVPGHAAVQPAWSPDGTRIAFADAREDGGGTIRLQAIDADGTGLVALTDPPARTSDQQPAWAPDGSRIAFVRVRATNAGIRSQVATIAPDGSDLRVLHEATEPTAPRFFTSVTWSPDGGRLLFTRTRLANQGFRHTLF